MENTANGYSYINQGISFGGQVELRGYSRKLRTFYYLDLGLGVAYHRFSDWEFKWKEGQGADRYEKEFWNSYLTDLYAKYDFPTSKWAFTFHAKAGIYTCLTKGLYADLSFGCIGRFIDHTTSELATYFKGSDLYPFGISLGLRFGRED